MNWYDRAKEIAKKIVLATPVQFVVDTPALNDNGDRIGPASLATQYALEDPNNPGPWNQTINQSLEDLRNPPNITSEAEAEALKLKQLRDREGGTDSDDQSMASIEGTHGQEYQRDGGPKFHQTLNQGIGTGPFS